MQAHDTAIGDSDILYQAYLRTFITKTKCLGIPTDLKPSKVRAVVRKIIENPVDMDFGGNFFTAACRHTHHEDSDQKTCIRTCFR